jgi:hypothetical protein
VAASTAEVDSVRAGAVFEVEDSLALAGLAAGHVHTAAAPITVRVLVTAGVGRLAAPLTEVEHTVAWAEPGGRPMPGIGGRRMAALDSRAPAAQ